MSGGRSVGFEIDDSELRALAVDLTEAPGRIQRKAHKTLGDAGDLVNRAMKRDARGHRYLPRFPRNISNGFVGEFTQEIGFNRSRGLQGALVWIILEGSINNAPVWDYTAGLRRETPHILEMMAGTAEDATLGSKEA